jgi:catechol 2,3-dioxygenase-like lactoylglutathione lyase family enzyme
MTDETVMDWRIELIFVPVTDVDVAKEFYTRIGFHPDHDQTPYDGLRFVQMTPPGSACSIAFGTGLGVDLEPGKQNTIQVVVPDADQALAHLREVGADADGVDEQAWGRFVTFRDPDGNRWTLQQLLPR